MENPSKSYQVAYTYSNYVKNTTAHTKKDFMPLPSCIPEEEYSTWQVAELKPENIFHNNGQRKVKKNDLLPTKGYECVGFKQVQAYASKDGKKKARINSLFKRNSDSVLSFSRVSQTKISNKYMTKEEVIKLYGKSNNKHLVSQLEELYISKQNSMLKQTFSTQNTTLGNYRFTHQQSLRNTLNHDFSISKIKQKFINYKGEWARQANKKNLKASHNRSKIVKFDSILKDSASFREKMQKLGLNKINQMNNNLQAKMWTQMLRNTGQIQKQIVVQKIINSSLECRGKSKLIKQIKWVQEKDRLGFYFKSLKDEKKKMLA